MNILDVNQVGGFPMTTRILDELQKIPRVLNGLGALAGNMTIIYGCTELGSTVGNGVVFVNGEVLEFRGGTIQTKVIIKEDTENLVFENNESKTVIRTRYMTFGNGVNSMNWADFKRGFETKEIAAALAAKTEQTTFEALADAFALVYTKLLTIEEGAQKNKDEYYQYGLVTTLNRQAGDYWGDFTKNYFQILPPAGYTMAHLKAFIPSIAKIQFAGDVNADDTLWCRYQLEIDKITVTCNNDENRSASEISYLAIWKK